jgi:hypothetical protein
MEYHGIEMVGPFITEKVLANPEPSEANKGRIVYNTVTDKINFIGSSGIESIDKLMYLSKYNTFSDAISAANLASKSLIIDKPVDLGGETVDCLGVGLVWLSEGNVISNGTLSNLGISAEPIHIFGTDITLSGTINSAVAYPEWFTKNTAPGTTPMSDAVQSAVDICNVIALGGTTYFFDRVVEIPSYRLIYGKGKNRTFLKSALTSSGSQDIFVNSDISGGNTHITLKGFTMDGNASSFVGGAATLPDANHCLLILRNSTDIKLDDIHITGFATDFDTSPTGGDKHYSASWVYGCERIEATNLSIEQSKEEGFQFVNCKKLFLDGFRAYNDDAIWTPLQVRSDSLASYSQYNSLSNVYIDGSGGSGMNINGEFFKLNNITIMNPGNGFLDIGSEGMAVGEYSRNFQISNVSCYSGPAFPHTGQAEGIAFSGKNFQISKVFVDDTDIAIMSLSENTENVTVSEVTASNLRLVREIGGIQPTAIKFRSSKNVQIKDIIVYESSSDGVNIQDCDNVKVESLTTSDIGSKPLRITDSTNFKGVNINTENPNVTFTGSLVTTIGVCDNISLRDSIINGSTGTYGVEFSTDTTNADVSNITGDSSLIFDASHSSSCVISKQTSTRGYAMALEMAGFYIWPDSTGTLRINNTRPTSDTDGTVVGTQV